MEPDKRIWLYNLAALHLALAGGIALCLDFRNNQLGGLALGSIAAQAALLAVLTAWAPWPLALRLPLALVGLAASWFSVMMVLLREGHDGQDGVAALLFAGLILGEYFGLLFCFWLARAVTSWRLNPAADEQNAPPADDRPAVAVPALPAPVDSQFRIQHVLLWMAIVAAALAVGRLLLPSLSFDGGPFLGATIVAFGLITLGNALLAIPLCALLLVPEVGWMARLGAFFLLIWFPVLLAGQVGSFLLFVPAFGPGSSVLELAGAYFLIDATQVVILSASLLLLRAYGFRLADGEM